MQLERSKRPHGTGSLYQLNGSWYGSWRVNGRQVKKKLGPCRKPGTSEGLTKTQAENRLRVSMQETRAAPVLQERITVKEAGTRLIAHLESLGRKPSTIDDYKSILCVHLQAHFGSKPLAKITPCDVEAYITAKRHAKQAVKTTLNQLGFLHSIFEFGRRRGWATENPCTRVDKPQKPDSQPLRFLNDTELEDLLQATADPTDRAIFLTAAMTGLRQGELLALKWDDIDWDAKRVRVRRNRVRGRAGTPKSKRSSRSVPLAPRVAHELDRYFKRSRFQAGDDLVFPHPLTGQPLDPSRLRVRFKDALKRGGVRQVRFHDLRHTFGARMAAMPGLSLRTLQEWMGHRDFATTLIYADYQPGAREAELVEAAFLSNKPSNKLSDTEEHSETLAVLESD